MQIIKLGEGIEIGFRSNPQLTLKVKLSDGTILPIHFSGDAVILHLPKPSDASKVTDLLDANYGSIDGEQILLKTWRFQTDLGDDLKATTEWAYYLYQQYQSLTK